MTDPRAYARAFVAEWRWYRGTREVPTSERDREMLTAALDDLLAEAEFLDAVRATDHANEGPPTVGRLK